MNLRDRARGQACYGRLPGCSFDPEQTSLAHIRRGNIAGTGQKPPDVCGLPMDKNCHDIFDGRAPLPKGWKRSDVDAEVLRGFVQWLAWLDKSGKINGVRHGTQDSRSPS